VKLPGGGQSTFIPAGSVPVEETMPVEFAPAAIQELFDTQLEQIARRCGYKDSAHYIHVELGGVLYNYTLTFHSAHVIHARPAFDGDEPGWNVWDLMLQNQALMYFGDVLPRPNGVKLPMTAVVQVAGDCLGRTGEARTCDASGAVGPYASCALPVVSKEEALTNTEWGQQMRIVATLQGGMPPVKTKPPRSRPQTGINPSIAMTAHNSSSSTSTTADAPGPILESFNNIPIKREPVPKPKANPKKRASRSSTRGTAPKPSSPATATSASSTSAGKKGGGVLVLYARLPRVGDEAFAHNKSKFSPAKVLALYNNFVEVDTLGPTKTTKTSPITVKSGSHFQIVLPPMDDRARHDVFPLGAIYRD
jgi:hypothetical protein